MSDQDEVTTLRQRVEALELEGDTDRRLMSEAAKALAHQMISGGWRCFFCWSNFTDEAEAKEHFGEHSGERPACLKAGMVTMDAVVLARIAGMRRSRRLPPSPNPPCPPHRQEIAEMGTVLVDYYDAECVRCGWKHRVMIGGGMGTLHAHTLAVARHANATFGRCTAYPDEIREQPPASNVTGAQE